MVQMLGRNTTVGSAHPSFANSRMGRRASINQLLQLSKQKAQKRKV